MIKKFYLIESSTESEDGSFNPRIHAVIYSNKEEMQQKVQLFLEHHMSYVQERDCDELDVRFLTEYYFDARMSQVMKSINDSDLSDISFGCPEWQTSYRIREIPASNENLYPTKEETGIILEVDVVNSENADTWGYLNENVSLRAIDSPSDPERTKNPDYEEISLILDEFNLRGFDW